jgi:hypothetical protein
MLHALSTRLHDVTTQKTTIKTNASLLTKHFIAFLPFIFLLLSFGLRAATSLRCSLQNTIQTFGGRSTLSTLFSENNVVALNVYLRGMKPYGGVKD